MRRWQGWGARRGGSPPFNISDLIRIVAVGVNPRRAVVVVVRGGGVIANKPSGY